ncbi:hypothetical protein MIND_00554500 [Mycena indigotica]|uniref:Uncharacterized protein n=1 Tax=Mycena indigotica TaxID=2126181 RepID=A0A8H6SWN0_9AGAR|nr:uncharacterized protein MIND_00554500 [Mycena indigotica]KAF7307595.1 hypothetical protein MIND_00554500 [Mycena indigotica]
MLAMDSVFFVHLLFLGYTGAQPIVVNSEPPPYSTFDSQRYFVSDILLLALVISIVCAHFWRAGRSQKQTAPVIGIESNAVQASPAPNIPVVQPRNSWTPFLRSNSLSSTEPLSRSDTSTTRALYISNQNYRAQQKVADLEPESTELRRSTQSFPSTRFSTTSSQTMTTLKPQWTRDLDVPPIPQAVQPEREIEEVLRVPGEEYLHGKRQ